MLNKSKTKTRIKNKSKELKKNKLRINKNWFKSSFSFVRNILSVLGAISLLLGIYSYKPIIEVNPNYNIYKTDPLTFGFNLKNNSIFSLKDLSISYHAKHIKYHGMTSWGISINDYHYSEYPPIKELKPYHTSTEYFIVGVGEKVRQILEVDLLTVTITYKISFLNIYFSEKQQFRAYLQDDHTLKWINYTN